MYVYTYRVFENSSNHMFPQAAEVSVEVVDYSLFISILFPSTFMMLLLKSDLLKIIKSINN